MKRTMNQVLNNLKPFCVYIVSVLIGMSVTFLGYEVFGFNIFYIVYTVLGILIGIKTDIKRDKYGLISYVVMLAIAPIISLLIESIVTPEFGIDNLVFGISNLSNMFYGLWNPVFNYEPFILAYSYAVVIPLLPIVLGFGIRKAINAKKAKTI